MIPPRTRSFRALAMAWLIACSGGGSALAQSAPQIDAAWARPTVAGQSAGGAFVTITGGTAADRLLSASSPASKTMELHTMEMDGNVMRMRQIPAIDVPAGKTVALKPGASHLMFTGLSQPLKVGASIPVTFRFEKAGDVTVQMTVMAQPMADGGHGMHKH